MPVTAAALHEREIASWSRPQHGIDLGAARSYAANTLFYRTDWGMAQPPTTWQQLYEAGKKKTSKEKEMPSGLQMELERLSEEKKTITKTIASSEKEIAELRVKYEVDKKRWVALKSGTASKPPDAPEEAKADAKPDAKAAPKKS